MSTKPLVVVSGSTGAQGGSVVNSLHDTGRYRIRALTRNVNSEKAKALANKGIEVFKCDLSVRQDVENALKGADIAFIVTNFWDPSIIGNDPTEEERQGKMIADVAKATGLNWLIYSSLVDPAAESNGKYSRIVHFSGKNIVEQYIRSLSLPCATFVYLGFYSGNFNSPFAKLYEKDGVVEVYVPYLTEDDVLPVADAAADTGPVVAKIIEEGPTSWNGRKVPIAAEFISLKNICESFTKATGKPHKVKTLTDEDLSNDPNSSDEVKEMFGWFKEYGYYGRNDKEANDLSITKKLHPTITTFQQYVDKTYGKK